jgi:BMFP domain-containing protein YqiC
MSSDNIQRQIEFILEHQAKFSEDISQLRAAIGELKDTQSQQGEMLSLIVTEMVADRRETREVLNSMITEIQDGFNKLILGNEVTREFTNQVARLAAGTSQRVSGLEQRVTDLESKQ